MNYVLTVLILKQMRGPGKDEAFRDYTDTCAMKSALTVSIKYS